MYVRIEFNDGRPNLHMDNVISVSEYDYVLRIMYKNAIGKNRVIGFSLDHVSGWLVCNPERRKQAERMFISDR
jgi:hypothetical protein